jgi:hypothetical protein
VAVEGDTGSLAYFGAGGGVGVLHAGVGLGDRRGGGGFVLVVAVDAADSDGELGEPAAPGLEAVAENAKGVAGAAEGVAAVVCGVIGGGGRWRRAVRQDWRQLPTRVAAELGHKGPTAVG